MVSSLNLLWQDTVKKPIDETPEFYPTFDMVDNFPVARRLYSTGVTYGSGIYYGGAVDHMELAVCLDIKEDNYTVAQKAMELAELMAMVGNLTAELLALRMQVAGSRRQYLLITVTA